MTTTPADPVYETELLRRAAQIRLLVLDVDGVLTDGRLHYDGDGREWKSFHVRDGQGIQLIMQAGLRVAVISGRRSRAAEVRMEELRVPHVLLGRSDKLPALQALLAQLQISPASLASVGDDIADLPVMQIAALPIAVADAHASVRAAARWVTRLPGGQGAVREVCDLLLAARGNRQG